MTMMIQVSLEPQPQILCLFLFTCRSLFLGDAGVGINSIGVGSGRRGGDDRFTSETLRTIPNGIVRLVACTRYQDAFRGIYRNDIISHHLDFEMQISARRERKALSVANAK